jgi:hypothetical protein
MRHSWIYEVLYDLRAFAQLNGLNRLATKVAEAEDAARADIAELPVPDNDNGPKN